MSSSKKKFTFSSLLQQLKSSLYSKHFLIGFIIVLALLGMYLALGETETSSLQPGVEPEEAKTTIGIPFSDATLDLKSISLLFAAILIGIIDGFNPCAMWVLIYLITLVSGMQDKKKMWVIVGTFLLASGVMYFIILAGWLNLFMVVGWSQWVLFAVGAFAILTGLYSLQDFYKKGGKIVCEVGDLNSKKKTMNKIKDIVHSPLTLATLGATIALAFAVNTIEFVCSAGLPAVFTQLLAVAGVSVIEKYLYILVYVFFFMLDDLIIFSLAVFAINSTLMERYSGLTKLLGGIIMIIIGVILLFFPELLAS